MQVFTLTWAMIEANDEPKTAVFAIPTTKWQTSKHSHALSRLRPGSLLGGELVDE